MAQLALGDIKIKYTKKAANNTVHREKLRGTVHFESHTCTQRAVNNTVQQAKLTGNRTIYPRSNPRTHTHTNCAL